MSTTNKQATDVTYAKHHQLQQVPQFRMVHSCTRIKKCPINLLLLAMKLHPEQLYQADEYGLIPLHYAIRHRNMSWYDIIETIVQTYPPAVTVPDPQTRLYPFMALAVDERAPLTAVYSVLRLCPELDRFLIV